MSTQPILLEVLNRGVQVAVDGADLAVRAVKGALTPELREQVQSAKDELIDFIGSDRRLARMSYAQRRMWFIDRLTPGSALYTATAATYRLRGEIDTGALEGSSERGHRTARGIADDISVRQRRTCAVHSACLLN